MSINKDLLAKVKRIELKTSRLVTYVFAGQYHSVFRGQGIEFEEVREYQMGDDVRTIDWNVTARMGKPFVKKFVEERELTVMILMDASASTRFGTSGQFKGQLAAEIASLVSLAAIRNQDKVGLMMFTDHVEKFIPPKKGKLHVLRVIREILSFKPRHRLTDINAAHTHWGMQFYPANIMKIKVNIITLFIKIKITDLYRQHNKRNKANKNQYANLCFIMHFHLFVPFLC